MEITIKFNHPSKDFIRVVKEQYPDRDFKEIVPFTEALVTLRCKKLHSLYLCYLRQVAISFSDVYRLIVESTVLSEDSDDGFNQIMFSFLVNNIQLIPISLRYGARSVDRKFTLKVENRTSSIKSIYSDDIIPDNGVTTDPLFDRNQEIGIIKPNSYCYIKDIVLRRKNFMDEDIFLNTSLAISGPIKHHDKIEVEEVVEIDESSENITKEVHRRENTNCYHGYTVSETIEPSMDTSVSLKFTGIEDGDKETLIGVINDVIDNIVSKYEKFQQLVKKLSESNSSSIHGDGYKYVYSEGLLVMEMCERQVFSTLLTLELASYVDSVITSVNDDLLTIKVLKEGSTKKTLCRTVSESTTKILKNFNNMKN